MGTTVTYAVELVDKQRAVASGTAGKLKLLAISRACCQQNCLLKLKIGIWHPFLEGLISFAEPLAVLQRCQCLGCSSTPLRGNSTDDPAKTDEYGGFVTASGRAKEHLK